MGNFKSEHIYPRFGLSFHIKKSLFFVLFLWWYFYRSAYRLDWYKRHPYKYESHNTNGNVHFLYFSAGTWPCCWVYALVYNTAGLFTLSAVVIVCAHLHRFVLFLLPPSTLVSFSKKDSFFRLSNFYASTITLGQ